MAMPGRGGILTCHIETIETLYASYLSFVNNGALFVPSDQPQQLGDEVFIAVTLPNSSERLILSFLKLRVWHKQSNKIVSKWLYKKMAVIWLMVLRLPVAMRLN